MQHPVELVAAAATSFARLVATDAVGAAWDVESACPPYTVGGLIAHTTASVSWFGRVLQAAPPTGDPPRLTAVAYFPTVDAGGDHVHAALVQRGNERAAKGVDANRGHLEAAVAALRAVDPAPPQRLLDLRPAMPGTMTVADFARTRLLELVAHGDDVATSVGLELEVDPAVGAVLLDYLVEWGRATHGDVGLVRAFVRGERASGVLPLL